MGRSREGAKRAVPADPAKTSTVACVSGFLVNVVDASVQLVSPCRANGRWPLGYRVHARGTYGSVSEFTELLAEMMSARLMPDRLSLDHRIRFRSDVTCETLPDEGGFEVRSSFMNACFTSEYYAPVTELARAVAHDGYTVAELALAMRGTEAPATLFVLEEFFRLGLLEDDPEAVYISVS